MGMFDNIRCKFPLPLPEFQENDFQTKDTPNQYCDQYEIREDGTLWVEKYDTEDKSKAGAWLRDNPGKTHTDLPAELSGISAMCGCMSRVHKRWVKLEDFHGDIEFYNAIGKQGTGWIEFRARFTNGKLSKLELVEHRPVNPDDEDKRRRELDEFFKQLK